MSLKLTRYLLKKRRNIFTDYQNRNDKSTQVNGKVRKPGKGVGVAGRYQDSFEKEI